MNNKNNSPKGWENKQAFPQKWINSNNAEVNNVVSPWANKKTTNSSSWGEITNTPNPERNNTPKNSISEETKRRMEEGADSAKERGKAFLDHVYQNATSTFSELKSKESEAANNKQLLNTKTDESPIEKEVTEKISVIEKNEIPSPYTKVVDNQVQPLEVDGSPNGKSKTIIIVLFAAIILIGGIVGCILFIKNKDDNTDPSKIKNSNSIVSESTSVSIENTKTTTVVTTTTSGSTTIAETTVEQTVVKEYPASDINNYPEYINFLKSNIDSNKYKGMYNTSEVGYALYDINADNTPELVVLAGNPDIYSIYNGAAVELTPFWGGNMVKGIFLYESGYIGMTTISPEGEGYTSYFKYSGGPDCKRTESSAEVVGKEITIPFTPITNIVDINNFISASNTSKPMVSTTYTKESSTDNIDRDLMYEEYNNMKIERDLMYEKYNNLVDEYNALIMEADRAFDEMAAATGEDAEAKKAKWESILERAGRIGEEADNLKAKFAYIEDQVESLRKSLEKIS